MQVGSLEINDQVKAVGIPKWGVFTRAGDN